MSLKVISVALLDGHGDVAWNVTAPDRRGGTSLFRDGRCWPPCSIACGN
jgi:hypothetical protein